jgi:hypothetical protein
MADLEIHKPVFYRKFWYQHGDAKRAGGEPIKIYSRNIKQEPDPFLWKYCGTVDWIEIVKARANAAIDRKQRKAVLCRATQLGLAPDLQQLCAGYSGDSGVQ